MWSCFPKCGTTFHKLASLISSTLCVTDVSQIVDTLTWYFWLMTPLSICPLSYYIRTRLFHDIYPVVKMRCVLEKLIQQLWFSLTDWLARLQTMSYFHLLIISQYFLMQHSQSAAVSTWEIFVPAGNFKRLFSYFMFGGHLAAVHRARKAAVILSGQLYPIKKKLCAL